MEVHEEIQALREALQAEVAKTAAAAADAELFRQGLKAAISALRMLEDSGRTEIVRDGCDIGRIEVFDLSEKKVATIEVKPVSEGGEGDPHAS